MRTRYRDGMVYDRAGGRLVPMDLVTENGVVIALGSDVSIDVDRTVSLRGLSVFPGFADVHVHLREPGFSYKETIATGTRACAHGGYTVVCAMPNLDPPPDSPEHMRAEQEIIDRDAVIRVLPYASITVGQRGEGRVTDMAALSKMAVGFSDDGRGVRDRETMLEAMRRCRAADSLIAAHCEDLSLIPRGAGIHAGRYAAAHGLAGISSESETAPIVRDIELCRETGCRYHVCHVSARESLEAIRAAKANGVDITCETAPHYLLLCDDDLPDDPQAADAGRFKMNPPLRSADDRHALIAGLLDGTIDCIATDHAPHSAEEKARGLTGSAMGIVGIETAFPLLYTYLVRTGKVPLSVLIDRLCFRPRERFRIDGGIGIGDRLEMTAFDLDTEEVIDPAGFLSKGRATPFAGWNVHAACRMTVIGEETVWQSPSYMTGET